jgi:predicted Zn-dependent peptidase
VIGRLAPLALSLSLALGCASAPKPAPAPQAASAAAPADPRAEVPPRGPPPELTLPPQKRFALSNGLQVRLVEYRRLPIVALHLVLDAGGLHDPPGQPGLASFTAAMMTEGTRRRSAIGISDDLGFIGASVGAGASFDSASLSGSALSRHLDALLDVYADVLLHPTFPKADFARVKDQRIVSLVQQRDQPGTIAAKAFAEAYWGRHPYGHWLMGTEESLAAMRREDLQRFHARWWRPGRAELVVVGDVSEGELRAKLERALGGWKGAPPAAAAPPPPAAAGARTVLLAKADAPQTFLMLGTPGLPRASPDYAAAEVAYQILGGGMASRLFRNLREEKGYTYGVYARGEERKLGGTSLVVGSVKGDVTGKALEEVLEELRRMREAPPTAEELTNAKNALALSLPADFATAGGIASKIAEEVVFGLPEGYWTRLVDEIQAVTAEDVQRVSARYLDPARLTAVMVGEPSSVRPQLASLPLGSIELRPAPGSERARPAKATGSGANAAKRQPARPSHLLPRKPEPRAER